ncbi:MAG TPA: dTMP kinase [Sphingomicrobium sp.]|nr:dTMP kinase [Sphingomicrobium sp.]
MSSRGRFISLEGGEGVGKSTQLRVLAAALRERGLKVVETREPGGSEGAESIRRLLLEEQDWPIEAEALLFAAARADHVEKTIRPALDRGEWVLSDRFIDSSLAYQGGAGGLGIERVRELHQFATGGFFPDRTLILTLPEGKQRAQARDGHSGDRIGGRGGDFHHKVELAFQMIAAEEPERVKLVEAAGSEGDVTERLLGAISDLLP